MPRPSRSGASSAPATSTAFFRTASGPGWALLGDAGHHKDPITAQGMTDALLHAELLATAIVEGLSGSRPLDAALLDYGRRRDEAAQPMHALTADLARLAPPPPAMAALLDALRDNPADTAPLSRRDRRNGSGRRLLRSRQPRAHRPAPISPHERRITNTHHEWSLS